jgi:uncharacterized protein YfaS (alpha-2-macroglobulin family)
MPAATNAPTIWPTNTPTTSSVTVNSLATGTMSKGKFTATNTFRRGSNVYVRAHVVNQSGANASGATVSMSLLMPSGNGYCTFTATSDARGLALGFCKVYKNAPAGIWHAYVNSVGASAVTGGSVTDAAFTER